MSTTQGVFRVHPETGVVARLGPLETSTEAVAVAGDVMVAAVTPGYGRPMRDPLRPASQQGAVRSHDGGKTWQPLRDGVAGQQVTALAARRDRPEGGTPATLVAGTDPAELQVSRDGGLTWMQGQSLREMPGYGEWSYPLAPHTPHVMVIAPHPTQADTIYAGIEVGGIVRSDDGGSTWGVVGNRRGEAVHPDIHGLAISPADPMVIYAATPQGVFVSRDGGERWQQRIDGLEPLYCRPIIVHQEDPDVAVVVATHGASGFFGIPAERTGGAVFRTTDGGGTWQRVTAGLPAPLAPTPAMVADPDEPGRVYLPLFSGGVYVSEDGGMQWRELARGLPPILRAVAA
ncbi:MAG: WD40/YVTN/BNR-like repeat-containing protein [Chloroflexota bacterium]